ncbi:MAG: SPFH domain-containing protein [Clostridiales bacterium]|jgi:membrane protease subunit (stomatin/prohibitin family)|nr:SPFH domain-containing protein [Clostridiales bacterium]
MAQFVIACPKCGSYAQAKTGFFAKKKIDCACGYTIDVRTDSLSAKECAHCGNTVLYDQREGENAVCPVCKRPVNTLADINRTAPFTCPRCGCGLHADKAAKAFTCPVCELEIDNVQKLFQLEKISGEGLASVIKYEGDNSTFVWKHPVEDFNLGSQLIVHESQEAIFFRDGQALDLFPAGRHVLETASIPMIEQLYNSFLEPRGVFHSEVYFVNLTTQMGIKWGTDNKVRFLEPVTGIPFDIGASGEFNIRVSDSRRLVLRLVGTEGGLNRDVLLAQGANPGGGMTGYFRAMIMTRVKTHLAKAIKENAINILEIDEHLDALSGALRITLNQGLEEYGLTMPEFFITNLVLPEDDKNFKDLKALHAHQYLNVQAEQVRKAEVEAAAERKAAEAQTDARMKVINAQGGADVLRINAQAEAEANRVKAQASAEAYRLQAEAEALEMKMKGYTYAQETSRQVGLEAVKGGIVKEGEGGGIGDIAMLGVKLSTMGSVVNLTKDALSPIMDASKEIGQAAGGLANPADAGWDCACGEKAVTSNFCPHCGAKKPDVSGAWDCVCGEKAITGRFCPSCGAKRPEKESPWSCSCGQTGNTKRFCSNCGAKKPEAWDCVCGRKGITGNFCDICGSKRVVIEKEDGGDGE